MANGTRKTRQWVTSDIDSNVLAAGATQIIRNMTTDFETVMGRNSASVTVLAMKGTIQLTHGSTSSGPFPTKNAFGIAWIPENLVTVAEVPNPLDEDYDWIWREVVYGVGPHTSGNPLLGEGFPGIKVDSRSMRRQQQTSSKLCLIGRAEGAASINRIGNIRTLYALP